MAAYKCPVCDSDVEVSDQAKVGERITCPSCFAQLALHKHKKETLLACAVCKDPVFDPGNCEDCERRREKRRLLDEGRL